MNELQHIAYVIPHTDVTAEMDCHIMLPGHVLHAQRMWLGEVGENAERKMVEEELPGALRCLKGIVPYKCAIFGCTSASAVNGADGMAEIERLMTSELGCPSITVLRAVLNEIERRRARSVAVLTPYSEEVNRFFRETIERFGVQISYISGMGLSIDTEVAALKPKDILAYAQAQKGLIPGHTDLCFFSCTNLRAAEIRTHLEGLMECPCISSNQCVIDWIKALPDASSN